MTVEEKIRRRVARSIEAEVARARQYVREMGGRDVGELLRPGGRREKAAPGRGRSRTSGQT